ncbi:MAG: hypothetical protein IKR93_02545 [Firmicutes bacterium]|nr:hypothetical protein [Bacillota bacterium]
MAYDIEKFNNDELYFQERLEKGKVPDNQISAMQMSDRTLEIINEKFNPLNNFGIEMGEDGKVPEKDGVPRIFMLQKDENGIDRVKSLDEGGVKPGSREFWQQVQEGNVFAYPAGSEHPVQVQAEIKATSAPKVGYSYQVDMDNVNMSPAGHEYKEPNAFTRFMNRIFSSWRKTDCEIYRERQKLAANSEKRVKGKDSEIAELKEAEKRDAARKEKAAQKKAYENLAKTTGYKEKGKEFYRDLTAPQPKLHNEWLSTPDKESFYTLDEFNSLKPIDNNFGNYQVGGQTVSQDEYCGLVMACSFDAKNIDKAFPKESSYDDTLKQSLMNCGYSEKQANKVIVGSYSTMISDDIMKGNLRVKQGVHLEDSVNPARHQAFDILEEYKKGNKAPLAEKIADCIAETASVTDEYTHCPENGAFNHFEFAASLGDMMERDPVLKKMAMDNGLKQEDIDAVNSMREYSKLDSKRGEAQTALAKAVYEGKELSYQEKLQYTKDIITANIFEAQIISENNQRLMNGKAIDKEQNRLGAEARKNGLVLDQNKISEYAKNPGTRPLPPKGQLYDDQVTALMQGRKAEFNKHPEGLLEMNDPGAVKDARMIAEDIIGQNGLADMSVKDLNKAVNSPASMYNGAKLIDMADKSAQKIQQQRYYDELGIPGPQVEKNAELDKKVEYKAPQAGVAVV